MPKIRTRHVVIGGGILVVALLLLQFIRPRGGEDDPPPIIVSSGGSIKVNINAAAPDDSALDGAWLGGFWYHAVGAKQHLPDSLEVTVLGATDGTNLCTSYPGIKMLTITYGDGKKKIDADIGWVLGLQLGPHLRFKGTPNGNSNPKNPKEVDYAEGEAVVLESVKIFPDGGGQPITCTFPTPTDPKSQSITIQERHTTAPPPKQTAR